MNTATTIKTQEAADKASEALKPILSKIANQLESGLDTETIRKKYGVEAGSIIAEMIRTSYLLGHGFIEQFAGRTIILSQTSLQQMNLEIQNAIDAFWSRMESIRQEQEKKKLQAKVIGAAGEAGIISSFLLFASQLTTTFSFKTLGKSTVQTMRQNFQDKALQQTGAKSVTITTPDGTSTITNRTSAQPVTPMLIWVSERDSKVCPQCQNLDGRTFDANDPDIPTPGPDTLGGVTHWGCRCRQLPLVDGKAFNA